MAISPEDIEAKYCIKDLEEEIDNKLMEEWKGKGAVLVPVPADMPDSALAKLVTIYNAAGWNVTVDNYPADNCKDGPYYLLTFTQKREHEAAVTKGAAIIAIAAKRMKAELKEALDNPLEYAKELARKHDKTTLS